MLAATAAGGALGALLRWSLALAWPSGGGTFPWSTLVVNVTGCLLAGIIGGRLAAAATRAGRAAPPGRRPRSRLVRPLVVTGVLGGYTTFSTWAVDVDQLIASGHLGLAVADLVLTVTGAVLAAVLGLALADRGDPGRPRTPRRPGP